MVLKPSFVTMLSFLLVNPLMAQESIPILHQPEAILLTAPAQGDGVGAPVEAQPLQLPKTAAQPSREWAWFVVGSALVSGAFLAVRGLSAECAGETRCRRLASLSFWGGIGIASGGTIFGLTLVQQGQDSGVLNQAGLSVAGSF